MHQTQRLDDKNDNLGNAFGQMEQCPNDAFDSITRLAMRLLDVPVALICIRHHNQERHFFSRQQNQSQMLTCSGQSQSTQVLCEQVRLTGQAVMVRDLRDMVLEGQQYGMNHTGELAYLGVPILGVDGEAIGALSVVQPNPRNWSERELSLLKDLGSCVNDEILLRASLIKQAEDQRRQSRINALRESITIAFMAPDLTIEERFDHLLQSGCKAFDADQGALIKVADHWPETLASYGVAASDRGAIRYDLSMTSQVESHAGLVQFSNPNTALAQGAKLLNGTVPAAFLGCPIYVEGLFFGTLEFACKTARKDPWSEDEISMLSLIAMFAGEHLGFYDQIVTLRRSESALLAYLADAKNIKETGRDDLVFPDKPPAIFSRPLS